MNIIICLDDNNGMMFNRRRQSRDQEVIKDIVKLTGNGRLWVTEYSAKLFSDIEVQISSEPWKTAESKEYCFIEEIDPVKILEKTERIVVYKWNRVYPADVKCSIDFTELQFIEETEFPGCSHEKITRQIYKK